MSEHQFKSSVMDTADACAGGGACGGEGWVVGALSRGHCTQFRRATGVGGSGAASAGEINLLAIRLRIRGISASERPVTVARRDSRVAFGRIWRGGTTYALQHTDDAVGMTT